MPSNPPSRARWAALLIPLAILVVGGHWALWASDESTAFKMRLTALNAAGWLVALGPVFLVGRWLRAVERRNGSGPPAGGGDPGS